MDDILITKIKANFNYKKKKVKINEKELQQIIHDIYKNYYITDGDISENLEEMLDCVKDIYLQVNSVSNENIHELENIIDDMLIKRLPIEEPVLSIEEIEFNTKQISFLKGLPQPAQRTPEWYTFRNNRLTASDLACAVDKNPYSTRDKLILKKCGIEEPWTPGPAIIHGVKYEDEAIRCYAERNNVIVEEYGCVPHPTIPFFGASPDGICDPKSENKNYVGRMLEIKCPRSRPITGFPPEYYAAQVQGQLEVCDLEYCDFLEADIREYKSKKQYLDDSFETEKNGEKYKDTRIRKNGNEKGVVIELYDHNLKKMIYEYAKSSMSQFEVEAWEEQVIDKSLQNEMLDYVTTSYWYLNEYCVTLIKRDKVWFNNIYPNIEKFWNDVLYHRENGIKGLIKEKKLYKKKEEELKFLD